MYKQLLSTIGTEKKESNDCLSLLIPEEIRSILQSSLQIAR